VVWIVNWKSISSRLASVAVTSVTAFQMDGSVDYGSVGENARFLVDRGIDVIVPCGNTGEFTSLDIDEAKKITSAVVEASGGGAAVVAGVGWSTPVAIQMARHAKDVGATAVMVHHPTHTYINRLGLRRYYERILDESGIGIVLYKRGPDLTDSLIADLVRDPRVVGVKYAVNDLNAFTNLVSRSHGTDTAWICGTAERAAPFFWLGGANGFSSGLANFAPELALLMLNALRAGDYSGAMQVRAKVATFEDLRQENDSANNVPAVKEAMAGVGLCTRLVREPLSELTDADKIRVQDIVRSWALEAPQAAVR
jgi:4-hydroxy-tetrahydrodipicolinate synthase